MQLSLTRKLSLPALFLLALYVTSVQANGPDSGLSSAEQSSYLERVKQLYLTRDERQALLAHCNSLLDTYALRAAYQVGQSPREDLRYELRLGRPGELLLREDVRAIQGVERSVSTRRIGVFGVDPFIRYDCPAGAVQCVLRNPVDDSPLLSIVRDHQGAAELAKALSFLIRNLQKG